MRLKVPLASTRSSRILKVVIRTTAIVVGLAATSGLSYAAGSFVMAQLETSPTQRSEPTQVPMGENERIPLDTDRLRQEQNFLAEAPAKMQLDRAMRLAEINRFQDAIAEASKIPFNSALYQPAQQSIGQWSGQVLQTEAEQRDMQQKQQTEHETNQQHLQSAQQALMENNWSTALQEAKQISSSPLWQQQKKAITDQAEPVEHEQKARRFLEQGEFHNAIAEAGKLSDVVPWGEKKEAIIAQARQGLDRKEMAVKRNKLCRQWAKGYVGECPNPDDLINVGEKLSPLQRLIELMPLSRKSKQ